MFRDTIKFFFTKPALKYEILVDSFSFLSMPHHDHLEMKRHVHIGRSYRVWISGI